MQLYGNDNSDVFQMISGSYVLSYLLKIRSFFFVFTRNRLLLQQKSSRRFSIVYKFDDFSY